MQLITGDTYLAGLWKASLLHGLTWLLDPEDAEFKDAKRPTTYRAPSWSWACVEGTIGYGVTSNDIFVAEVVQCEVEPVDPRNPFGAVSDGRLVTRGPLHEVGVGSVDEHCVFDSTDALDRSQIRIYLDGYKEHPLPNVFPDSIQSF
jgi:hypothetical protein